MGKILGLVMVIFLVFIGLTFVSELQPTLGNATYEGGGIGATIFGLAQEWIPPIAILGLMFWGFRKLMSR